VSAWPRIVSWIESTSRQVDVLAPERGDETLRLLEVSAESTLGAVAHATGGIVVDGGWLRLLGGGSDELPSLAEWAGLARRQRVEPVAGGVCVAFDAVGGFFVLLEQTRHVHSFLPDTLTWLDTRLTYSQFVHWTLHGDLDGFYGELREWRETSRDLAPGEALSIHESRGATRPIEELWALYPGGKLHGLLATRSTA
jgi:uncharacterized protein DUF2625